MGKRILVMGLLAALAVAVAAPATPARAAGPVTFEAWTYQVGLSPIDIAVADFSGDGWDDLAVANSASSDITLLFNEAGETGGGWFHEPSCSPTEIWVQPHTLAAADTTRDGRPDLVMGTASGGLVGFFANDGTGDFAPPTSYSLGQTAGPMHVIAGNFNSTIGPDLAIYTSTTGVLYVFYSRAEGGWDIMNTTPGTVGAGVAAGLLSTDDTVDFATLRLGSGNDSVGLYTTDSGYFVLYDTVDVQDGGDAVIAPDLNGDDRPDLVVPNYTSNSLSVRLSTINSVTGRVNWSGPDYSLGDGAGPLDVVAADLDGDGNLDLITADASTNDLTIKLNDGTGVFPPEATQVEEVGSSPRSVVAGDFNKDGWADLAVANFGDNTVTVLINTTGGEEPPPAARLTRPSKVELGLICNPAVGGQLQGGQFVLDVPAGVVDAPEGATFVLRLTSLPPQDVGPALWAVTDRQRFRFHQRAYRVEAFLVENGIETPVTKFDEPLSLAHFPVWFCGRLVEGWGTSGLTRIAEGGTLEELPGTTVQGNLVVEIPCPGLYYLGQVLRP